MLICSEVSKGEAREKPQEERQGEKEGEARETQGSRRQSRKEVVRKGPVPSESLGGGDA